MIKMLQATHTKTFPRYFLRFRSMAPLRHLSGDLEDKLVRRRWPLSMNIVLVLTPHEVCILKIKTAFNVKMRVYTLRQWFFSVFFSLKETCFRNGRYGGTERYHAIIGNGSV